VSASSPSHLPLPHRFSFCAIGDAVLEVARDEFCSVCNGYAIFVAFEVALSVVLEDLMWIQVQITCTQVDHPADEN